MDTKIFSEIGLTENESEIYLTLLKEGELSANEISEKIGLHRGYVYDTLSKLTNKGITSCVIKSGKKKFKGVHPNKLLDIIKEKEEKICKLLPELVGLYKQEKTEYQVEILEGKEGLKTYLNELLDYLITGNHKEVLQLGRKVSMEEHLLKYYMANQVKKAEKHGLMNKLKEGNINARALLDISARHEKRLITRLMECRYLPEKFDTGGKDIIIVGNKVTIESLDSKPFAIVVTNKGLADFFRNLFNTLWEISSK